MTPSASIIIPTRERPGYLAVALRSLAPQALEWAAEIIVVEDGDSVETAALAADAGARYVALGTPQGLNDARNAGIAAATGELLAFVDDDVEVHDGWLAALLSAARAQPEIGMFTGPIIARLEGPPRHTCGREGPPITHTDLGPGDRDVTRAWGANMAIRRSALEHVGDFDPDRSCWGGDEEEWERRHLAAGGRIRYVGAAALDHRRTAADATLPALMRAASARGVQARRGEEQDGRAPSIAHELRILAGCIWHTARRRCANGPIMAAHSAGRLRAAARPPASNDAERPDDFLSGESGTVGGRRDVLRTMADLALDAVALPQRVTLARAARSTPRRRILVLSIVRPHLRAHHEAAVAELRRSHHEIDIAQREPGALGKFENLNLLLDTQPAIEHDWLVVLDDDVTLPRGFLDGFIHQAERHELRVAQPAHRLRSHAAWRVTRRRALSAVRETSFVEIGPVTGLHRETFAALLPFPPLRMGWGLDAHWAALARTHGWRIGVVDLLPIAHRLAPAGAAYPREEAVAEARAFLANRPYLPARELQRTLVVHRRCV